MSKIKSSLLHNFGWKVLSVVIAIILWFVGMNVNNPIMNTTDYVTLSLRNVNALDNNGIVLFNETEVLNTKVSVKIKGTKNDLINYKKENIHVVAYVNFEPIDISNKKNINKSVPISIYVESPNISKYEIIDYSPKTVNIVLDNKSTIKKKITPNVIGELTDGYITSNTVLIEPEEVTIEGPSSIIDSVDSAVVTANVSGLTGTTTIDAPITLFDEKGSNITDKFKLTPKDGFVTIPISWYGQISIDTPATIGSPASGYRLIGVKKDISYVTVVGKESDIKSLTSIKLDPIDINNITASKSVTVDLSEYLKTYNLAPKEGTPRFITYTATIEKELTATLEVPTSNFTVSGTNPDVHLDSTVHVQITGLESDVVTVSLDQIKGKIDLSKADFNTNTIPVEVTLPSHVQEITPTTISFSDGTGDMNSTDSTDIVPNESILD